MDFFERHSDSQFTVYASGPYNNITQSISVHALESGYQLQTLINKVKIVTDQADEWIYLNLDDYFTGFRRSINITYSKSSSSNSQKEILDPTLLYHPPTVSLTGNYPFSFINQDGKKQKGLVYLGNNSYIYVDCQQIYYLDVVGDMTTLNRHQNHSIPGIIDKISYIPGLLSFKNRTDSLGTLSIEYSMNGNEEILKYCDVNPDLDVA